LEYQKIKTSDTSLTEETETTLPNYKIIQSNSTSQSSASNIKSSKTEETETTCSTELNIQFTKTLDSPVSMTKRSKSNIRLSLQVYVNDGKNKVEEERLETVLKNRDSNSNPKCVTLSTSNQTQDVIEMNLSTLDDDDETGSGMDSKENIASENKPELVIISKKTEETTCSTLSNSTPKTRNSKNMKKKKTLSNIIKKYYSIMNARQ